MVALLATAAFGAPQTEHSRAPSASSAGPVFKAVPPRPLRPYRRAVPILMYHLVQAMPAGAPNPGLYVRPSIFAAQMRWLRRHGYQAVTLARLVDAWHGRALLPRQPIVLSFDDGYVGDYTNVLPLLRRWRWPGVLNLTLSAFRARGGLTHVEVRALIRAGWELAAHTISHIDLTTVHGRQLWREVDGCRRILQAEFHVPVTDFAYPSGRYDSEVVRAVRAAGYRAAVTTTPGLATYRLPFTLPRLRVDGRTGVLGFVYQLPRA